MNWFKKNKIMAFSVAALFMATGTYNAVVINSESLLENSQTKFVKRLDEVYGITVEGRKIASNVQWKKLTPTKVATKSKTTIELNEAPKVTSAPVESIPVALVQEELSLSLVEVINPKKWEKGIAEGQFSGSLMANAGVIEELSVMLPGGESVLVSFSEMTGNVFAYELNGEEFSGMMYQVDQNAYMVTLTNGPLEGTRMRFSSQSAFEQQNEVQNTLAESNVEIGNFGQAPQSNPQITNENIATDNVQAQGFNFDQQVI